VIGLYVESVRDLPSFTRTLSAAIQAKPVVVCPLARTPFGQAASLAHVGIAADRPARGWQPVFPARRSSCTPVWICSTWHAPLLWQGRPLRGKRPRHRHPAPAASAPRSPIWQQSRGMSVPRFSARLTGRHCPSPAALCRQRQSRRSHAGVGATIRDSIRS
jgi:hypothetical protein